MAIAYQCNASGSFVGPIEDYGLLPNNATRAIPSEKAGYVPRWTGSVWEQVENNKGREGYLNGQPYTVEDYGPLPEGFSETPPEPDPSGTEAPETRQSALTHPACARHTARRGPDFQSINT